MTDRTRRTLAGFLFFAAATGTAQAECLTEDGIRHLDAQYEAALLHNSVAFLEEHLHPDFVWVHNHAARIEESLDALVEPRRAVARAGQPGISVRRDQDDVSVVIDGHTAVIYGFTDVERTAAFVERTGNPRRVRYHFMRTYTGGAGVCRLLANHTMEVWREGEPEF